MENFEVISKCSICEKEDVLCAKITLITKDKTQEIENWCEDCYNKEIKEIARQNEELMYEVYDDIIRSSH